MSEVRGRQAALEAESLLAVQVGALHEVAAVAATVESLKHIFKMYILIYSIPLAYLALGAPFPFAFWSAQRVDRHLLVVLVEKPPGIRRSKLLLVKNFQYVKTEYSTDAFFAA